MYIKAKLYSDITNSLIDTGASRSLINLEFLKQINGPKPLILGTDPCSLKGVSGNVIKSIGTVKNVPVTIDKFVTAADFIVVEELSEPVIFGIDFIGTIKAKRDYQNHTFSNSNFVVKLLKVEQSTPNNFVNSLKTVQEVIKVKHEQEILCSIEGDQSFIPKNYVYFPDPELWQHGSKLQSQGWEIKLTQPKVYTKIYNPNKKAR